MVRSADIRDTTVRDADPQHLTILGWMRSSKVFGRCMNETLRSVLHDALLRNGLSGPQYGLMDALCHGHPDTGDPVPRTAAMLGDGAVTYGGVSEAIDAWAEGLGGWAVSMVVAYDASSSMHRQERDDWKRVRTGLFMDCLRDGDPMLVPEDGMMLTEWKRPRIQGYRAVWYGESRQPKDFRGVGLGDLYYHMARIAPDDAMGTLRRMGWRRAADLIGVTRYGFRPYGYSAKESRDLAIECLERYGTDTLDRCLEVFSLMSRGEWRSGVPDAGAMHEGRDLPVGFLNEDAAAHMDPTMQRVAEPSDYSAMVHTFREWWLTVGRHAPGPGHNARSDRVPAIIGYRNFRFCGLAPRLEDRCVCAGIMERMRAIPSDVYTLCDDLFSLATDSPGELSEVLADGGDSLLRCSVIVAAMRTTRRSGDIPHLTGFAPWMRRYIATGDAGDAADRGVGIHDMVRGLPTTVSGMQGLVGTGRYARTLQDLLGEPSDMGGL